MQNVLIYLFKDLFEYFVSHITIISRNDVFLCYRTPQICLCCIIFSNALQETEYINSKCLNDCLVFSIRYFRVRKRWCLQNVCLIKEWMMVEIVDKNVFEIMALSNNLLFICKFKTIILYSVYSAWSVKCVFSAKKWFVITSTRIVKYELRVAKSNPIWIVKTVTWK